jgi:hypothetical protein
LPHATRHSKAEFLLLLYFSRIFGTKRESAIPKDGAGDGTRWYWAVLGGIRGCPYPYGMPRETRSDDCLEVSGADHPEAGPSGASVGTHTSCRGPLVGRRGSLLPPPSPNTCSNPHDGSVVACSPASRRLIAERERIGNAQHKNRIISWPAGSYANGMT